jgi:hypothetical protein
LDAIREDDSGADERQEVRAVEPTPPRLRHVQELVGHRKPLQAGAHLLSRAAAAAPSRTGTRSRCWSEMRSTLLELGYLDGTAILPL